MYLRSQIWDRQMFHTFREKHVIRLTTFQQIWSINYAISHAQQAYRLLDKMLLLSNKVNRRKWTKDLKTITERVLHKRLTALTPWTNKNEVEEKQTDDQVDVAIIQGIYRRRIFYTQTGILFGLSKTKPEDSDRHGITEFHSVLYMRMN